MTKHTVNGIRDAHIDERGLIVVEGRCCSDGPMDTGFTIEDLHDLIDRANEVRYDWDEKRQAALRQAEADIQERVDDIARIQKEAKDGAV